MQLTQRKTKSINYWLINSPTCPALSFFGSLQWYFLSNYNKSIDWRIHSKYCHCISLSDWSFYLQNWHISIEIFWINYKLFISNPHLLSLRPSNTTNGLTVVHISFTVMHLIKRWNQSRSLFRLNNIANLNTSQTARLLFLIQTSVPFICINLW